MATRPRPGPAARLVVGLAATLQPTAADRRRYQAEFVAELHGLPRSARLRYATGVLSQALPLRAALSSAPARLEEVAMEPWGRRLRCRVLRWHHWQLRSTEDGGRYRACSVCAREHIGPRGPNNTIG